MQRKGKLFATVRARDKSGRKRWAASNRIALKRTIAVTSCRKERKLEPLCILQARIPHSQRRVKDVKP